MFDDSKAPNYARKRKSFNKYFYLYLIHIMARKGKIFLHLPNDSLNNFNKEEFYDKVIYLLK